MRRPDSVMRKSQRLNNGNFITIVCKAVEGVFGYAMHRGEDIYLDPHNCRPFYFSHLGKAMRTWVTTSPENTTFGHGLNACPDLGGIPPLDLRQSAEGVATTEAVASVIAGRWDQAYIPDASKKS
ncbi:uncharacterized protein PpBr36_09541 [Pyricularia pennisetigena]|uniref:uncharacterized protein n=1 Tax=Pyricularia pennisetigena TaxID=1578925 RepID=UPI00114F1201|nr:uncharacterized protein PpBr36_09541 [Pyricularia pennisetigena]TLS22081.1 hypothetical protein PpBr36_09541 [Pyricularia pennisetigena]